MTYDRYGNRTAQTVTAGAGVPSNSVTVDATTNRVTGAPYAYDANGNMTNDGANTLVYDAWDRLISSTQAGVTTSYAYDGNGLRVRKCAPNCTSPTSSTVYIFSGTKVIAEYDNGAAPGSPSREYIYSGSALLAKIDSTGTKYYHQDHLSNRLVTDSTGTVTAQLGHYPFGESWYNASNDKLLFTSYERDSESGNDFAIARYHVNRLGRFSSPDLVAGSVSNPQSFNRYGYVQNDPVNLADPSSQVPLWLCLIDGGCPLLNFAPSGVGPAPLNSLDLLAVAFTPTGYGDGRLVPGTEDETYYPPIYGNLGLLSLLGLTNPIPGGNRGNTSGFTLGIRAPGQTYKQCLAANAHTYSAGGAAELAVNVATGTNTDITSNRAIDFFIGNSVNSFLFGNATDAGLAAARQAPGALEAGVGAGLTYGRRTSGSIALNLAGKGGLPQALSSSTGGLKSVF